MSKNCSSKLKTYKPEVNISYKYSYTIYRSISMLSYRIYRLASRSSHSIQRRNLLPKG